MRRAWLAAGVFLLVLGCGEESLCPPLGSVFVDAPGSADAGSAVTVSFSYSTPRRCVPDGGDIAFESAALGPDGGSVSSSSSDTVVHGTDTETVNAQLQFTPDAPGTWTVVGTVRASDAFVGSDAGVVDSTQRAIVVSP